MEDEDHLFDPPASPPALDVEIDEHVDSPASTTSTLDSSEVKKKGRKGKVKEPPFHWKDELVFFLIDKWQEETMSGVTKKRIHPKRMNEIQEKKANLSL